MDGTAGQAVEDRLYGLMEVAERQQVAAQATLEKLAAERAALAREREALARGVAGLQSGTQGAVRAAVAESLAGATTEGVAAVQAATGPLLSRLAAAVTLLVLSGWLASAGVLWWDTGAIAAARAEKA